MQSLRPLLVGGRRAVSRPLLSAAWTRQQRRQQHQQADAATGRRSWAQQNKLEMEERRRKRQESVPLYDLPRVVLDLDAEDSPHVRPYDEAMEAAETARWRGAHASVDDLEDRLAAFEEEAKEADARLAAVAASPTPWRVSDRDIWSVVLGGGRRVGQEGEEGEEGEEGSVMAELLHENGVSARIAADPAKTVRFMLQRQDLAARDGNGGDRLDGSADGFEAALAQCGRFVEVRRLLSLATRSSAHGCRTVAQAGAAVVARLASVSSSASPTSTLVMLLNLSHSFEAKDVGLGSDLCGLGLHEAAAAMEPAAMRRFLDIGLARGCLSDETVRAALSTLCAGLRRRRAGALAEIFPVLVGETATDALSGASFRAAILATATADTADTGVTCLTSASPPTREAYLSLLAELGAVRTLWQELRLCGLAETDVASNNSSIASMDTLTTSVLRHAYFTADRPEERQAATMDAAEEQDDVEDEKLLYRLDLQVLRAFDEAAEARESGMERAVETAIASSKQFQADVAAAFCRPTAQEVMYDIRLLLPQILLRARATE